MRGTISRVPFPQWSKICYTSKCVCDADNGEKNSRKTFVNSGRHIDSSSNNCTSKWLLVLLLSSHDFFFLLRFLFYFVALIEPKGGLVMVWIVWLVQHSNLLEAASLTQSRCVLKHFLFFLEVYFFIALILVLINLKSSFRFKPMLISIQWRCHCLWCVVHFMTLPFPRYFITLSLCWWYWFELLSVPLAPNPFVKTKNASV